MNNGQGLPVIFFGGGYNCIHLWKPAYGEIKDKVFKSNNWEGSYNKVSDIAGVGKRSAKQVKTDELELAKKLAKIGF